MYRRTPARPYFARGRAGLKAQNLHSNQNTGLREGTFYHTKNEVIGLQMHLTGRGLISLDFYHSLPFSLAKRCLSERYNREHVTQIIRLCFDRSIEDLGRYYLYNFTQ